MSVPPIQYREGGSIAHRLHPLAKLEIFALVAVSVFAFGPAVNAALAAALMVFSLLIQEVRTTLARILKTTPLLILLIVAAHVILVRNGQPLGGRVLTGLFQGLRVLVLFLSGGLFLALTDPLRLSDSVVSLLAPLESFGLNTEEISLVVMIMASFIPQMAEEADRIKTARMVRSGRGKWLSRRTGGVVPFIAPLVASVVRRSYQLDLALSARYYGNKEVRRPYHRIKLSGFEAVLMVIAAFSFLAGTYAKY